MINTHRFPNAVIDAIREQPSISKVFYISKGSSEYLYVATYEHDSKEVFNIIAYGEVRIKDYIKDFYSKPVDQLSYAEKNSFEKLIIFINTIFSEYQLESVEIGGTKMSQRVDIEEFLKSIS